MAELTAARPAAPKRHPAEIAVDRVWRFFCSVRAAIWEVSILAVMVLIGTLRGSAVPRWIADLVPPLEGIVDRWYAYDIFHSLPFAAMLALLAIAICVCTINRVPGIWESIIHPTVTTSRGFLTSADIGATYREQSVDGVDNGTLIDYLKRNRYRVLTEHVRGETHLYADKNRFGKLGTFPFHLALILILVGGIVGARYGFRDTEFVVAEGTTEQVGHGTGLSVMLDDFQDSYNQIGQPVEYRSELVLYDGGKEIKREAVTVNNPMTYKSVVFYQTSFGPAVNLVITDPAGQIVYDGAIPLGLYNARENPDAPAGLMSLPSIGRNLIVIGPDANPAFQPERDTLKLRSGDLMLQLTDPSAGAASQQSAVVSIGKSVQLGGYSVTFVRDQHWTLLQVASNPGIPIFWTAAFMLIGGLGIVFYFPHRRLRGIMTTAPDGTKQVHLAALAKRDWSAKRSFDDLIRRFGEKHSIDVTIVRRDIEAAPRSELAPQH